MKINSKVLALSLVQANVWGAIAFVVKGPKGDTKPSFVLHSSSYVPGGDFRLSGDMSDPTGGDALFPFDVPYERIEGGDTLRTWKMPIGVERVYMAFKSDGRPLKTKVNMWLGPIRQTHNLEISMQNGAKTPYRACLKFKKTDSAGPQMLTIRNTGDYEFPVFAAVDIPSEERSEDFADNTDKIWAMGTPTLVQGSKAVRSFPIDPNVESVHFVMSSKAVGGRGPKARVEVLQAPNNDKQVFTIQCSGGSQPYHGVFATPGAGVTLRITNEKPLEFPIEVVVVPNEVKEPIDPFAPNKQWWE